MMFPPSGAGKDLKMEGVHIHQLAPLRSDARIATVWLAQTHVMQPDQPYFKFTGNRETLLKADVVSLSGAMAPEVFALINRGGQTNSLALKGPALLPQSLPSEPMRVQHRFEDCFTAKIPAELVRSGMSIIFHAGTNVWQHEIKVGTPPVVPMKMFNRHHVYEKLPVESRVEAVMKFVHDRSSGGQKILACETHAAFVTLKGWGNSPPSVTQLIQINICA